MSGLEDVIIVLALVSIPGMVVLRWRGAMTDSLALTLKGLVIWYILLGTVGLLVC